MDNNHTEILFKDIFGIFCEIAYCSDQSEIASTKKSSKGNSDFKICFQFHSETYLCLWFIDENQGCYNIGISFISDRFKIYPISGISKVPNIRYCTTDFALAGLVKYLYTSF